MAEGQKQETENSARIQGAFDPFLWAQVQHLDEAFGTRAVTDRVEGRSGADLRHCETL
jgi:hypothetical protein